MFCAFITFGFILNVCVCVCMEFTVIYDTYLCFIVVAFRCFNKDILCLALSFKVYNDEA